MCELVPQDLGAPNVITGILLTYRAFDTLGEVAVLFMVAAGVGLVLGAPASQATHEREAQTPNADPARHQRNRAERQPQILVPLISIFAAYIIMNGHLSAGGGFQGGAVIASGVMLLLLAKPAIQAQRRLSQHHRIGCRRAVRSGRHCRLIFAGGFLDNRVLPLGQFGAFFSAGAIPVLSVLLGVKVGCELSVIIDRFRG